MAQVLIIDDDRDMLKMLRQMLEQQGYKVVEAADTEEGVARYLQHDVDLVITDLFMPVRGGLEVMRELQERDPKVKIIVISGVDIRHDLDVVTLARQHGARYAFKKPFDRDELMAAVEDVLGED